MTNSRNIARFISDNYLYLSILVVCAVLAGVVHYSEQPFFRNFVGSWNPIFIVLLSGAIGIPCFIVLSRCAKLAIRKTSREPRWHVIGGLAVLFGTAAILIDVSFHLPAEINVPFPWSLFFYPAIALIAEIIFHIVPLTLMVLIVTRGTSTAISERAMLLLILVAALVEPLFHLHDMITTGTYSIGAILSVTLLVYLFSIAQLWLYRRFDFLAMLALRLCHYLVWHIAWGYYRLELF